MIARPEWGLDDVDYEGVAYQQGRCDGMKEVWDAYRRMRAWSLVWCLLALAGWFLALWLLGHLVVA